MWGSSYVYKSNPVYEVWQQRDEQLFCGQSEAEDVPDLENDLNEGWFKKEQNNYLFLK